MPKIRKDVQGYGMTGNNFFSYSFWLFITLFSRPYGLLDHSGDYEPSPKRVKSILGSHGEKLGLGLVNKELLNFTQKKFLVIKSRVGGSGLHKELKQTRELCYRRSPTL